MSADDVHCVHCVHDDDDDDDDDDDWFKHVLRI